MTSRPQQMIESLIRNIYNRLTDEEMQARNERRDEFFMSIRKKHGIARAQAEMLIRDLENQFPTDAGIMA